MGNDNRIKTLLSILDEDRKQVMLYVGVSFAVPTFFVSDIGLTGMPTEARIFAMIALIGYVLAGLCFFRYAFGMGSKRLRAIEVIMADDAEALRAELFGTGTGIWASYRGYFIAGELLLVISSVALVILLFLRFIIYQELAAT